MRDLLVNLLASIVAGTAVWAAQRLRRHQRMARKRAFFGLADGADCRLAVARHAASPHQLSVHRLDVAALVELATIAKDCGGRADLVSGEDKPEGIGRLTEFCVGGPSGNPRAAAHLRAMLPGVTVATIDPTTLEIRSGTAAFRRDPDRFEYAILARVWGPTGGRPVFLLGGQTARTNTAAARFLASRYRELHRRYGATGPFCLVLRVVEPGVYGSDFVEVAADLADTAFPPARPAPTPAGLPAQPKRPDQGELPAEPPHQIEPPAQAGSPTGAELPAQAGRRAVADRTASRPVSSPEAVPDASLADPSDGTAA